MNAMEIEQDRDDILRLCWLVQQQRQVEIEYVRVKWRLAYYQKALREADSLESLEGERRAIIKQIEIMQILKLKTQKKLLDIKSKLQNKIAYVRNKLSAEIQSCDGVIMGIKYLIGVRGNSGLHWREFDVEQIVAMADEYEAERILDKVLTKQGI